MDEAAQFGVAGAIPGTGLSEKAARGKKVRADEPTTTRAGFAEQIFTVCVLILSTTAFVNLFPGESGVEFEQQGKLFAQVLWSILYILMLFLVRKRLTGFFRLICQDRFLVALLGWVCISIVWSIDQQVTIRHFVALLATTLFGVYLAVRYPIRELLRLVSFALGIVVVASVGACLAFPEYGISSENPFEYPAWQGVLSNKNNLATLVILEVLILILYFIRRIRRPLIVVGLSLLFFLVVLTQSKTALLYFILSIIALPFLRVFQRDPSKRGKIAAFALLIAAGLAMWTYFNWENFTYSLGKDPGLTGRFVLWGLAVASIRARPLLGYGFDAFWSSYYGPAADFRMASGWLAGATTQNGFLNLWLDLGLIGVLLFVVSFVITYRQALRLAKITKNSEGLWPVTFLTFLFVYGLTEISFVSRNNLYWILYIATGVGIRAVLRKEYKGA